MPVKVELLRLGGTSAPANWKEKKSFRTAVYISASRWDQTVKDSGQLLSRQSELCRAFLREHREFKKVETYADRNSSRETNREWNRLLDDVECRKVDAVLVTSIAQIEASCGMACYHVGRFFYPAGIRFVAVEDGFDSYQDDLELYLKRYANRYASFLGAQRHERRFNRNKVTSVSVPYGYIYVAGGTPEIVIDEETAPFVKELFALALQHTTVTEMARHMTEIGAPTPAARRRALYGQKVSGSEYWKSSVVKTILKNPCYTGDYVTGRTKERFLDGVNHFENVPCEDWLVIKNHHEPLIDRETYEKSISIMDSRRFENHRDKASAQNPFRNMFVCGHCGSVMTCNRAGSKSGRAYARIRCDATRFNKESRCEAYDVRMDETITKLRGELAAEICKANEAASLFPQMVGSAWYQETLSQLKARNSTAAAKILDRSLTKRERDDLYKELLRQKEKLQNFETAFSLDNPWVSLFTGIGDAATIEVDRQQVRAIFQKIEVFRNGEIKVHFIHEEWRAYIDAYLAKVGEKGSVDKWVDETEQ